jgi:hypothetical protein
MRLKEMLMTRNKMLSTLLLLAFATMPTVASAGAPELDSKSLDAGKTLSFTASGGSRELRASGEPTYKCTSTKATGRYNTRTTGELELTFSGCGGELGLLHPECHSIGQASGVITTGTSVFHNVYLKDDKSTPGILVTPPTSGVFTTIICAGFWNEELKGNGYIGGISSPMCGGSSTIGVWNFTASGSLQAYKQNTATGTSYSLSSTTEGSGSTTEAAEVRSESLTFAEAVTMTCV